jgi:cytochrome d ubiquinol oxidase subunit II
MHELLPILAAALAVIGLIAYIVLGGADFGGGVWDLFATGPRKHAQREALHRAIGPVWEANHVWLIFVIVVLFTCFPTAFAAMVTALFLPLHFALIGIMLRGAAFVFQHNGRKNPTLPGEQLHKITWQTIFGVSSLISPFFLGTIFGAITSGRINPAAPAAASLDLYCIACGFLAVAASAYLAAVFMCVEVHESALRNDFRLRAVIAGTATAALATLTLIAARFEAPWFFERLTKFWPIILPALAAFGLSAWAVFTRRYKLARISAVAEIVLMLAGWAAAQYPYILHPAATIQDAAAPLATIQFMVIAIFAGLVILIPSLLFLFRVFKSNPQSD